MTFWDWSAAVWSGRPAKDALLELQENHGQCVPLMLWGMWLTSRSGALGEDLAMRAVDLCRDWNDVVIEPTRAIRRRLAECQGGSELRDDLMTLELKAERALHDRLEALVVDDSTLNSAADGPGGRTDKSDAAHRLSHLATLWGRPLAPSAFETLGHV